MSVDERINQDTLDVVYGFINRVQSILSQSSIYKNEIEFRIPDVIRLQILNFYYIYIPARQKSKWDIVFLSSSPLVFGTDPYKPLPQFDIIQEKETCFQALKASKKNIRVTHKTATTSNLISAIVGRAKCLHYIGHGYPTYLAFEDSRRMGETHLIHHELMAVVCKDESHTIELVVAVTNDFENVGQAFVDAGVEHVVAIKNKFGAQDNLTSSDFIKHFYNALLSHHTISSSFTIANNAVSDIANNNRDNNPKTSISNDGTELRTPNDPNHNNTNKNRKNSETDNNEQIVALLPKNTNHDVHIFQDLMVGEFVNDTEPYAIHNLHNTGSFMGRQIDMKYIIQQLLSANVKITIVTGEEGIGKTSIVKMVGRYLCDRNKFSGGVYYVDIKKLNGECNSLESMLTGVFEECGVITTPSINNDNDGSRSDAYDSDSHDSRSHRSNILRNNSVNNNKTLKRNAKNNLFNIIRNLGDTLIILDDMDFFGDLNHTQQHGNLHYSNPVHGHPHHALYNNNLGLTSEERAESVQLFLQNLFAKCTADTKVIFTAEKDNVLRIQNYHRSFIPRFYELKKLKAKQAAKMFVRFCGQFKVHDILANGQLMAMLRANPKEIKKIAQIKHRFHCDTLDHVVKSYEMYNKNNFDKYHGAGGVVAIGVGGGGGGGNNLLQNNVHSYVDNTSQIIDEETESITHSHQSNPNHHFGLGQSVAHTISNPMHMAPAQHNHMTLPYPYASNRSNHSNHSNSNNHGNQRARIYWQMVAGNKEFAHYDEVFEVFKTQFIRNTNSFRVFGRNDLVESFRKIGKMQNFMIRAQFFEPLYEWFIALCDLVNLLMHEWNKTNPTVISGFLSRDYCNQLLGSNQVQSGTFVVRFSSSVAAALVISYKDIGTIQHIKAQLNRQTGKFAIALKNHAHAEMTLGAFIHKFRKITHLYDQPNHRCIHKKNVYFGVDDSKIIINQ